MLEGSWSLASLYPSLARWVKPQSKKTQAVTWSEDYNVKTLGYLHQNKWPCLSFVQQFQQLESTQVNLWHWGAHHQTLPWFTRLPSQTYLIKISALSFKNSGYSRIDPWLRNDSKIEKWFTMLDSISVQNVCTNLFWKGTIRFIVECSAAGISSATADQEDALETGMPLRMIFHSRNTDMPLTMILHSRNKKRYFNELHAFENDLAFTEYRHAFDNDLAFTE